MMTPIDLLLIAKERIDVNWEVYIANNHIICDNAREMYIIESNMYDSAIKFLNGETARKARAEYAKWHYKYTKNKNRNKKKYEVKSH